MSAHAQNAQSVRLGESALTFSAGSIRQEMPLEGVVNVITGDNQLSGNRMMVGWTGTDALYLKLNNPGDAALGISIPCTGAHARSFTPSPNST